MLLAKQVIDLEFSPKPLNREIPCKDAKNLINQIVQKGRSQCVLDMTFKPAIGPEHRFLDVVGFWSRVPTTTNLASYLE